MTTIQIVTTKSIINQNNTHLFDFYSIVDTELARLWCDSETRKQIPREKSEVRNRLTELKSDLKLKGLKLFNDKSTVCNVISCFISNEPNGKLFLYTHLTKIKDSNIWIYGSYDYDDKNVLPLNSYTQYLNKLINTVLLKGEYNEDEVVIDLILHNGDRDDWRIDSNGQTLDRTDEKEMLSIERNNINKIYTFSHINGFFEEYINGMILNGDGTLIDNYLI